MEIDNPNSEESDRAAISECDTVLQTFSQLAETGQGITPRIYEFYFERCPGSQALMAHVDHRMKGRMMDEVFKLLMTEELPRQRDYLRFETKTHEGYGVEPVMYENLLLAVMDSVKESLASTWTEGYESAWKIRLQSLLREIRTASPDNPDSA
jgi:hemoglobin-like flavoprotein